MSRLTTILFSILLGLLIITIVQTYRIKSLKENVTEIMVQSRLQQDEIEAMQLQRKRAAELDSRVTQELTNAKSEIKRLNADINSGTKRLQLNATCSKLPKANSTGSDTDATSPRLSESAQRDYFNLRERINTATIMIHGLQDYIRTQCQ